MAKLNNWLHQLQQRGVIRTGIGYAASAWILVQAAWVFLPALEAPEWVVPTLVVLATIGLIPVLLFSWFFEITPEGVQRWESVLPQAAPRPFFDRRVDFVIIGLLTGALALSVYANVREPPAPADPVSILIADFVNESGNALFSGVIEESFRIGLEVAPFVEVFSRADAAGIAAGLPGANFESGALDPATASIVALREGIDIVIGGNLNRTGGGLTLTVNATAPAEQRELFAMSESVQNDTDVLTAIARLANEVRAKLGDAEIPSGAGDSETFAVGNLEAAASYLVAQDLQRQQKYGEAAEHYERALEFDPEFTRAYAGLALANQYLGRPDEAEKHWDAALARLNRLTERGRLRTLGSYFATYRQDYERAVETYEELIGRFPADNVAHNNLAVSAFYALDFERALEVGREVADRFPSHSGYGANMALYAMYASQFDEAAEMADRINAAQSRNPYALLVAGLTSAIAGDFSAAEDAYTAMAELGQFGRSLSSEGLADLAIYRGDFAAALSVLEQSIEAEIAQDASHTAALKEVIRADVLLELGERDAAATAVEFALQNASGDPAVLVPAAMVLAELGDVQRAQAIAESMADSLSNVQHAHVDTIRAYVNLLAGRYPMALEHADSGLASADLWLLRFIRAQIRLAAGEAEAAAADLAACRERTGEAIAVFLNDRPSLRYLRDLEVTLARAEG
jgi:tetratricopeptide (TPR) repeat protein